MTRAGSPLIEIENREELLFFLAEAAELEHLLSCSYLFAGFSLKGDGEGLTAAQLASVSGWKEHVMSIAVQEMGHLARVNNLLTALGGAPHFDRPNFPQRGKYYPSHIHLTLAPFTQETLQSFVFLERPRLADAGEAPPQASGRAEHTVTDHEVMPEPQSYATVGDLYDGIERGLRQLVQRYGEAAIFIGPPGNQATEALFQLPALGAVTDLDSAAEAISAIVEEGEGTRGERDDTHYGTFRRMEREYQEHLTEDPAFAPARPTVANPCTRLPSDATGAALVEEQATVDLMDLFNATYGLMVQLLARFFIHNGETPAEVSALVEAAIGSMTGVLAPLGEAITRLPAGQSFGAARAGPSFEFHRVLKPSPHHDAAWVVLPEKARDLENYAGRLRERNNGPGELASVYEALGNITTTLAG